MIQLIWAILNIAIILYFIILCFKAVKLIRDNIGIFAAVVFSFVLLSFITNPKKDKDTESQSLRFDSKKQENKEVIKPFLNTYLSKTTIDEDLISTINLTVMYDAKKVLSANVNKTGFTGGTTWKPSFIDVQKIDNKNKCKYIIYGVNEWRLAGFLLYSQSKNYEGITELKNDFYIPK